MILQTMKIIQSQKRKKQNIIIVGLKILIDYSLTKTNVKIKPISVIDVYTVSPKKTCLSNTKEDCYGINDGQTEIPVIYRGKDVIEVFLNHLECVVSNINNIFVHPKPLVMTEKNKIDYKTATKCWICEQETTKNNPKVRDHCHFTSEYRGAAHKSCNLKLKIK